MHSMCYKVFFTFAAVTTAYAIWPEEMQPGESAALDFVMRVSRLTSKDLNYILNLQFWGNDDEAILEKAKNQDPYLHEKMVEFLSKYHNLSQEAKQYLDEVFEMAMEHTRSYYREQYYTLEQTNGAARLVGKLKLLPIREELFKAFPDIVANPPLEAEQ